jgi:hypothetical protein
MCSCVLLFFEVTEIQNAEDIFSACGVAAMPRRAKAGFLPCKSSKKNFLEQLNLQINPLRAPL